MSSVSLLWPFGYGAKERRQKRKGEEKLSLFEDLGVTQQLLDFAKSFTVDTFKDFPLQDDPMADGDLDHSAGRTPRKDLSEWQERHAMLLLDRSKEISQIRYVLCPRLLQDYQFWRIYFLLVKNYVLPYEMRAMQKAKVKKELEKENSCEKVGIEVELTESKLACCSETDEFPSGFSLGQTRK